VKSDTHKPAPLSSAWRAFEQFAALRVSSGDLEDDPMADALLFEAGTYDFGGKWGRSFEVTFVRQYGMKNGDLQQVHLVAHFAPLVFDRIRSGMKVIACAARFERDHPPGCIALCSYAGRHQLLGSPCRVVDGGTARSGGRTLQDLTVWSYDTGGSGVDAQHRSWLAFVDRSSSAELSRAASFSATRSGRTQPNDYIGSLRAQRPVGRASVRESTPTVTPSATTNAPAMPPERGRETGARSTVNSRHEHPG
jgi:hypothetical protein